MGDGLELPLLEAEAAAAARLHLRIVEVLTLPAPWEMGAKSELLSCHIAVSNLVSGGRLPHPGPSIRSVVRAIIEAVSGFSSVSCRETWRVPVPRIRDRLHRIEPRSPNSRPGVRPEGSSLALPMVSPEGQAPSRCVSRSRGRTPLPRCRFRSRVTLVDASLRFGPQTPPYRVRCRLCRSAQHPGPSPCLRHDRHAVGSQLPRTLACDDVVSLCRSHPSQHPGTLPT